MPAKANGGWLDKRDSSR